MTGAGDQLQPLAREIVEEAVALVARHGPSDAVLLELGVLLIRLASRIRKGAARPKHRTSRIPSNGHCWASATCAPVGSMPQNGGIMGAQRRTDFGK